MYAKKRPVAGAREVRRRVGGPHQAFLRGGKLGKRGRSKMVFRPGSMSLSPLYEARGMRPGKRNRPWFAKKMPLLVEQEGNCCGEKEKSGKNGVKRTDPHDEPQNKSDLGAGVRN